MPASAACGLEWWANLGDAAGGLAAAGGVLFAVLQVRSWRSQKLQERRADVAATLARAVYAVTGPSRSALLNPRRYRSAESQDPHTPPWVGLHQMYDGASSGLRTTDAALEELHKELTIARFYFSEDELETSRYVELAIDTVKEGLKDDLERAEERLPAPDAWTDFEEACHDCDSELRDIEERTIDSLKKAASYSEPRWFAWLRGSRS